MIPLRSMALSLLEHAVQRKKIRTGRAKRLSVKLKEDNMSDLHITTSWEPTWKGSDRSDN